mmetsp:Transcript_15136/g.60781  ORF Transcript_15136/g.60781 Transcript_15136/m.60781 type:complete len:374 (-) Transcript_15136:213-1334(-)
MCAACRSGTDHVLGPPPGSEDDDDDDVVTNADLVGDDDDFDDFDDFEDPGEKDLGFDMDALMARLGSEQGPGAFGQFGGAGDPAAQKVAGAGRNYRWTQARDVITAMVPVPQDVGASRVSVEFPTVSSISVAVDGTDLVRGELAGGVQRDETFWILDEDDDDDDGQKIISVEIRKREDSRQMWTGLLKAEGDATLATVTRRAYLDIDVNGTRLGRVVLGLFGDDLPKTVENFAALCDEADDRVPFSYANTPIHRIIPGFCVQAGDVVNGDGSGGTSIEGDGGFADEKFQFRHDKPGLLAMANAGPNTNKSQFYITCGQCSWLDSKHVIFGRVLDSGMEDVIYKLEDYGSVQGDPKPEGTEITIAACGLLDDDE